MYMQASRENPMLSSQMQDCIQDCLNSHATCVDTAMSAIQQGKSPDHIRLLLDCAEISLTTAHFMIRNSPLQGYVGSACSEVNGQCAEKCLQEGMVDCGNACRAAANSTQQMIKMMAIP